jgi:hypothetical protein
VSSSLTSAPTWRVGRVWVNATALKAVEQKCSVGSNPTLSSIYGRLAEPGLLHLFAKEALPKKQS